MACNIDGILTPSECAKLSETLKDAEGISPLRCGALNLTLYSGMRRIATRSKCEGHGRHLRVIAEVMNAAPRMLATIAAHEATIAGLKKYIHERDE